MVENLPSNVGDEGSIPGQGIKISPALGAVEPPHPTPAATKTCCSQK